MKNQRNNSLLQKGFVTLDVMLSMIPIILILMYGLNTISQLKQGTENNILEKQAFDKLYLISEQSVKQGMDVKREGMNFENWIDSSKMLNEKKEISIGFEPDGGNCIYRIVALGEMKEIKKIYFCF
ncbi:MAG: hypothetical protein ABII22_03955 [Candidatus Micrarchaeota archaeon]